MASRPASRERISSSSLSSGLEPSKRAKTKAASLTICRAFSTPIFSTTSSVARMPAVSIMRRGTPPTLAYSSMESRVVPGISVTIARSSCNKALSKLDLPTLGLPTIAVMSPSRRIRPVPAVLMSLAILLRTSTTFSATLSVTTSSTSSSGKSIAASKWAICPNISCRKDFIFAENAPVRWPVAIFSERSVLAVMISITACAWDKSRRPFKNARLVNSPPSAGLAPCA